MKKTVLESVAAYLMQGYTYKEAAEQWDVTPHCIQRNINEHYKYMDTKKFELLKNRPYMVFQRVIYTDCSLEEALKVWRVSQKRFDAFMRSIYAKNRKGYLKMRSQLEVAKRK